MKPIHIGLVADPASPTEMAHRISDLDPPGGEDAAVWDIEVVSEPFTTGSEDVDTALGRLADEAHRHEWDLVVGLTELPLRDRTAVTCWSRPTAATDGGVVALGGLRLHARTRHAVRALVSGMADRSSRDEHRVPLRGLRGRSRLLVGMVLANRPWLLVPGLKSALVAALATGAVATIDSTVWLLAVSLPWWHLVVTTIGSVALVVVWLVIDGELWIARTTTPPRLVRGRVCTTRRRY